MPIYIYIYIFNSSDTRRIHWARSLYCRMLKQIEVLAYAAYWLTYPPKNNFSWILGWPNSAAFLPVSRYVLTPSAK